MRESSRQSGAEVRGSHFPATVGLGASGALLGFLILLGPIYWSIPAVSLPAPLVPHHQSAETLLYVLAFAVLLPLTTWLAPRLVDRTLRGGNPSLAGPLAAVSVAVTAGILVLVRLVGPEGIELWTLSVLALIALCGLGLAWRRAAGDQWPAAAPMTGQSFSLACLGGLLTVLAIVSFGRPSGLDLPWLVVGLAVAAGVTFAYSKVRLPNPRGWVGRAIDLAVLVLVVLAVPDMVIFQGVGETGQPGNPFLTYVINFHQSLFLGADSQILGGSALLVDTVSQYGVASIYLLAAFFEIAPIGNGTLGFFDASLSALCFGGGYLVLRMVGVGRLFAAASMAFAIIVLVWALEYPIGGLLQHGGLRFGLPVPLIVLWVAAARFPGGRRWFRLAAWTVVGISSIWALEAFAYVTGALAGMLALEAALMSAGRLRWLGRQVAYAVVAWIITQVLFALVTLAAAGSLPDWGLYITYLRDFLAGDVGDITYDVPPWSPGLTVGFACFVSALNLAVIAIRQPDWLRQRPVAAVALAGLAGYGILLYSYFDNRSLAHVVPYISLPLVLSVAIWLWLVLRDASVPRRARQACLGIALGIVALSVSSVMPAAADRAKTSLLAYALPGGEPLDAGFQRLWNPPELAAGAARGAELLDQYMPGQTASPVLTKPDLDNNILSLAGRSNSLGITDAKEQSWVEGPHLEGVEQAAARLEPGDRMLMDAATIKAFTALFHDPGADRRQLIAETEVADIQLRILALVAERYRLRPIAGADGLVVVELIPR